VRRLADRYPVEHLGAKQLKNIAEPVDAFRVLGAPGEKPRPRRIESPAPRSMPEGAGQRRLGVVMALETEPLPSSAPDGAASAGWLAAVGDLVSAHRGQTLGEVEGHQIAQFGSPTDAVDCALAILGGQGDCGGRPRIGLHLGYILAEGGRVTGDGVELARYLLGRAEPGGLALSGRVRRNLSLEPELRCEEIETREVEGSVEPMPLYRAILPAARGPSETSSASAETSRHGPDRPLPQPDEASPEVSRKAAGAGPIPWPDDYRALEAHIREAWQVEDGLYLIRKLSGKSGALVYAVDITCRDFKGQAILKLDRAPDAGWSEQDEAQRHQQAMDAVPQFAAEHLPRVVHASSHDGQLGILTTIAGRGLEYAAPLLQCPYDRQLETVAQLSRELLDGWNRDYAFAKGMQRPQDLLRDWLRYRLDPAEGHIHGFLAGTCGLPAEAASFIADGRWYPNPLAFALAPSNGAGDIQLRAAVGHSHGDLHGLNVLIRPLEGGGSTYYLIDLALYRPDAFLFYDHAYFELSTLLQKRGEAGLSHWCALLRALDPRDQGRAGQAQNGDDLGIVQLIRSLRCETFAWIEEHEPNRLSYLESQVLLARVAVGLNFVNKPLEPAGRVKALLFAASELKSFLKLHAVEWDKQGAPLGLPGGE
jgi:class 3 adenylate cyclase